MSKTLPEWEVYPGIGFGPLRFGMTEEQCRAILGTDFQHEAYARRDRFDGGDFELEYDECGRLEFLSIGTYAERIPTLGGVRLLGRRRDSVMASLESLTHLVGVWHDELSVLYRPLHMDLCQSFGSDDEFASVDLGRPGYFD
jgi:hypothetical protein